MYFLFPSSMLPFERGGKNGDGGICQVYNRQKCILDSPSLWSTSFLALEAQGRGRAEEKMLPTAVAALRQQES
jgi:hypothetical protein